MLGILYESFIHPLTVLSGLPSAAVGALATLYLGHLLFKAGLFPSDVTLSLYLGVLASWRFTVAPPRLCASA